MRENMGLYRGKRIDNGEWVHGFYAQCDEEYDNGCEGHMYRECVATIHYIIDRKGNSVMVDSKTVGQYTGEEDGNCVQTYEGDIINSDSQVCVIKFENGAFYADGYWCGLQDVPYDLFSEGAVFEVIGNIHDNPELIGCE